MPPRVRLGLFLVAAFAFGYFHAGGGWNQNARFALVRAMVEEGRFAIDSFLVYDHRPEAPGALRRLPVRDGVIDRDGTPFVLTWTGIDRKPVPISPLAPAGATRVKVEDVAITGDVAFHAGRFHPNKAPGTSWAAVPAYALLRGLERLAAVSPDSWRVLTLNAWLTSWLSVGLVSAVGLVLFFDVARRLSASAAAAWLSAVALGFGTLYWTYATMLREHNLIAVALLASYAALLAARGQEPGSRRRLGLAASAGACAGAAVVMNYISLVPVVLLGGYLVLTERSRAPIAPALAFAAGAVLPLLGLAAYHQACFGQWLTTSYRYENPMFVSRGTALLGVLEWPRPERLLTLTISPFRGLLVSSPVLVLGLLGLRRLWAERERRLDAALYAALAAFFLLFNTAFNGWDGGWATGPRYLVPAFPFLALPMIRVLERPARWMWAVLAVSVALNAFANLVEPDAPVGTAGHAMRPGVPKWRHSPLLDYQWPLFWHGRARPLLDAQRDELLARVQAAWEKEGRSAAQIRDGLAAVRADVEGSVERGEVEPFELARVRGHVSVNPLGIYESWYFRLFSMDSPQARGNAFNVGEALLPGSRASGLPLLVVLAGGLGRLWRGVRPAEERRPATSARPSARSPRRAGQAR